MSFYIFEILIFKLLQVRGLDKFLHHTNVTINSKYEYLMYSEGNGMYLGFSINSHTLSCYYSKNESLQKFVIMRIRI